MKIAYLIDYDINISNGVIQKILQQSNQWIESGHKVYFISTKTLTVYDQDKNIITQIQPLNIGLGRFGTALKLLYSSYFLNKQFGKIGFDLLYMRYRLYMPFYKKVLSKYKVIMEINSDDTVEYKLHSKLTHFYNKFTRNFVLKHVDGFVSVSDELKQRFQYFNKPIEVIANGIDTSQYNLVPYKNDKPTFVFIGTPNQSWHGLDKIISMADHFQKYQFYIIGSTGKDTNNIKYFGYLSKDDSTKIIQKCDIGIATLSLYKKHLTEASPLKSRQYLACGIPIIYAYKDTDLEGKESFVLRLTNSENNINHTKIEQFVNNIFGKQNIKEESRKFAEKILDYKIKEKKRLDFFQKVLDEK